MVHPHHHPSLLPMPRRRKHLSSPTQYWIGYCRKSTDSEDKQVHTLQDQALMVRACYDNLPANERQGRPLKLLEEARSAYHPGRPVFQAIMQTADRGEVYGVIVVHPNRISRNHADSGTFVQRLVDRKIRCLATTGGQRYTADDSNAIFMLTLEGAMSWKDSRDKGDRILQAMRMRAAEGKHMGPVRIGYQIVFRPDGSKVLEIAPAVAPLVREIFVLAATGTYSVQALVNEAKKMGLRSRKGKVLLKTAIHKMLRDPIYKGFIRFDGIVTKGSHEPIVDSAVWERVQNALRSRSTNAARPKDLSLRDLFVFGSLLKCPRCGRTLCPYRAKRRYVYYDCKNVQTDCRIRVPQTVLVEQLPLLLQGISLDEAELGTMRIGLLAEHRKRTGEEIGARSKLNAEYELVVKEIGEVFSQRKEAEAMGILDEVDARLAELRRRRDEVQARLNAGHDKGAAWIEKVIRTFELLDLLQEAIFFGSSRPRELVLRGVASNFSVDGKTLIWKPRTPFLQAAQRGGRTQWWAGLYDAKTEIEETCSLLEIAYAVLESGRIVGA